MALTASLALKEPLSYVTVSFCASLKMPSRDLAVPISVHLDGPAGPSRRIGEPVTFGVPFPCGGAATDWRWELVGADQSFPVQSRVLDTWPDGSIRWLLVDTRIDVSGVESRRFRLIPGAEPLAAPLRVSNHGDGIEIDTGSAQFEFQPAAAFPLAAVTIDGAARLDRAATAFQVVDLFGRAHRAVTRQIAVVESGPVRASIKVEGTLEGPASPALALTAWIDLYAGLATARVAVRIRNPRPARHRGGFWDLGDPGSMLLKDVSWRLAVASRHGGPPSLRCSPEPGIPAATFELPFEIYQNSSGGENWGSPNHLNREHRVPLAFRGYRIKSGGWARSGLRATPIVTITSGGSEISMAVPHFWENFPRAIEASDSSLVLRLFPEQFDDLHEIQGGEQKTHAFFVGFADDGVTDVPLEWCRSRLICRVDPAWIRSTEAVPWLAPDDADHAALVTPAVEGKDTFEAKREVVDEYGWRHFGDIYGDHEAIRHKGPMPLVSHYNNQYDPIAGFIYQYLRGGATAWWSMAAELASHVVDIDVYHTTGDKSSYNHGMFWHTYHYGDADSATHRSYPRAAKGTVHGGGPSPDHTYTTGLMLHYFLTGDETSRETVIDLGQFVIDADDGRRTIFRWLSRARTGLATASGSYSYHGPGRGPANSLNDLLDAHRLSGEARFLEKAEELIRRVVHPSEPVERNRLDEPENKWFYLMFLQSLGKYLWYKNELAELDWMYGYARAALLHYARWMVEHEYPYLERPERLVFPTETWAAHEVRKSDVFYHAALHAEGPERDRFVERAQFFFSYAIETLSQMPTRTLARPIIVLLSSGLMKPWYEAHRPTPLPAARDSHMDFGQPVAFVTQKQIAIKRAKFAVVTVAVLVLLLLLIFYWFA